MTAFIFSGNDWRTIGEVIVIALIVLAMLICVVIIGFVGVVIAKERADTRHRRRLQARRRGWPK